MLGSSVGKGGGNRLPDVCVVQALLNRFLPSSGRLLRVDGLVGPKTVAAILHYQRHGVHLHHPDALVEPHGPTLRALMKKPEHGVIPHAPKPAAVATPTRPVTVRPSATRPAPRPPRPSLRRRDHR